LLTARRRARRAIHVIALAQPEAPHLRRRDVRVVAAGDVARCAQEAVALVAQVEQSFDVDLFAGGFVVASAAVAGSLALALTLAAAARTAAFAAVPSPAPTP